MRFQGDFVDAEGERSAVYAIRREDWEPPRPSARQDAHSFFQGGPT